MTASPSQPLSFPGLTGESRKALDARLRLAGMTRENSNGVLKGQINNKTFNKTLNRMKKSPSLAKYQIKGVLFFPFSR
jgi:hypothetical protein